MGKTSKANLKTRLGHAEGELTKWELQGTLEIMREFLKAGFMKLRAELLRKKCFRFPKP